MVDLMTIAPLWIGLIVLIAIWELVWKGIALWKSGRNNHLAWFIAILVLNTAGILPIIYILLNSNETVERKAKRP